MDFIPRPLGRFEYSSPFGCLVACDGVVHSKYAINRPTNQDD